MNTSTVRSFRFFREHAGYIVGRRAECALNLARAERDAAFAGVTYAWEYDADGELGDHEYWCLDAKRGVQHEHEIEYCAAYNADGDVVASLGGIIDADSAYRRVIEAELASEVLAA